MKRTFVEIENIILRVIKLVQVKKDLVSAFPQFFPFIMNDGFLTSSMRHYCDLKTLSFKET